MHRGAIASLFFFGALGASAQNPASDPYAISLAQQSITALTGGSVISDSTLIGNTSWIAGSDQESGTVTLNVKGLRESRVDLNLSNGTRTQIRNDTAGYPQGASILNGGNQQTWATHNCWVNPSWFFPALSYLAATSDPSLVFSYIGVETHRGATVQHLRISRYLAGQSPGQISLIQRLSAMDVYLDSQSLFPRAFAFTAHPDDDALTEIAVETLFSNYQAVNGIQVPFRIRRLVQGGLAVDVALTGAQFNTGLADILFAVQ